MLTFFDKLINPTLLIVLNILIIVAAEFVGGGTYFDKSGLIHAIAAIFIALIIVRIASDYAYGDAILKTFSKIQVGFLLILVIIHIYKHVGLPVFHLRPEIMVYSVLLTYFLWFVGNIIALQFMFRAYDGRPAFRYNMGWYLAVVLASYIVLLNFSSTFANAILSWAPHAVIIAVFALAIGTSVSLWRLMKIMPIFKNFGKYKIVANVLFALVASLEHPAVKGFLIDLGFPSAQYLYLSHYLLFIALSLLLVAVGKFKRPTGIYADL